MLHKHKKAILSLGYKITIYYDNIVDVLVRKKISESVATYLIFILIQETYASHTAIAKQIFVIFFLFARERKSSVCATQFFFCESVYGGYTGHVFK